ncbi:hypothetical protein M1523_03690 [Patescibacteria group bacterium]|nr:hypothetical protein [Patescibacteria group bacterium]MCL5091594.1 hypothetical protein [Patescibacteria group bacterium]
MHIGVDLDAVLADLITPLIQYHNRVYQTNHRLSDHTVYDLSVLWGCSGQETLKRLHDFYVSPDFLAVKPLPGAKTGIAYLSSKHKLSLITSRPHSISALTNAWISQHFPNRFSAIHHTNWVAKNPREPRQKKSAVGQALGIDAMIEDALEFALDLSTANIRVFLMDMPWNQTNRLPKNIVRIRHWKEIGKYL